MTTGNTTAVTRDHLTAFGGIVYVFAKIEFALQAMIGALAGTSLQVAVFMTGELGYRAKHNCLSNLASIARPGIVEELDVLLERVQRYSALRNHVAHSLWKPGLRPTSIKPIGVNPRSGKARILGVMDDEKEWTLEEIWNEGHQLEVLHKELFDFFERTGLKASIDRLLQDEAPPTPE